MSIFCKHMLNRVRIQVMNEEKSVTSGRGVALLFLPLKSLVDPEMEILSSPEVSI